jgi:hypothetical protein
LVGGKQVRMCLLKAGTEVSVGMTWHIEKKIQGMVLSEVEEVTIWLWNYFSIASKKYVWCESYILMWPSHAATVAALLAVASLIDIKDAG